MASVKQLSQKLDKIKSREENKKCFECGEKGTAYVCINFGTFICSRCALILSELNYKVKGTGVSFFNQKEIDLLDQMGNEEASKIWLAKYKEEKDKPQGLKDDDSLKNFIKDKYKEKKWYKKPKKNNKENEDDDEEEKRIKKDKIKDRKNKDESNDEKDESEEEKNPKTIPKNKENNKPNNKEESESEEKKPRKKKDEESSSSSSPDEKEEEEEENESNKNKIKIIKDFQLEIIKYINNKNLGKNIMISPLSIYHILSLTSNGAANTTLIEMLK